MPIAPQPPPQVEKRRRDSDESSDDDYGPSLPSTVNRPRSPSPESSSKRPRTIGPTLPPANLDERPLNPPDTTSESSDDDGFGPALPSTNKGGSRPKSTAQSVGTSPPSAAPTKTARDEWMLVPPTSGDWTSKVDPTKMKNRKFNTGKSAKGPAEAGGGVSAMWTETPAEKKARLEREMLGIQDTTGPKSVPRKDPQSEEKARKLREYTEKSRGQTLYTDHQKSNPREKEDDPSARAFDREKDIAGGMKINHTQRTEMMKKAADFGSRFSSAKYL